MNLMASSDENVFSVTQITSYIKEILESSFQTIKIEGEISNFRPSSAGHIYFTLKDENAQIKAVMFRGASFSLDFKPKDGDKVRCTGSLSVYAPQGSYQIIVNKMEPVGNGNILQMLEMRKQKLAKEGLFDSARKKPLPEFPKTIGVVTSPTGAAIQDILNVAARRNKSVNIIVLPAIVQGDGADKTIAKMIEIANFYKLCDLLIVGRGGGSLEDLLPFSEEIVVRAVAESEIPVISAVGHEIDWALCDYSADRRAPTPSAAAEMAIPLQSEIYQNIKYYKDDLYLQIKNKIENKKLLIKTFSPENMEIRFRNILHPIKNKIQNCISVLENASPQTILNRGYSMVTDEKGNVIRDSDSVNSGETLFIKPAKGQIEVQVK